MVCGNELKIFACTGVIGEMKVDFCDDHAEYCDNCERIICKVVKRE